MGHIQLGYPVQRRRRIFRRGRILLRDAADAAVPRLQETGRTLPGPDHRILILQRHPGRLYDHRQRDYTESVRSQPVRGEGTEEIPDVGVESSIQIIHLESPANI